MSDTNITITYNATIGSEGTGNGQFKFPSGIVALNDEIFVVDKQNHRVQVFNLAGAYQRKFGTSGSGNTNFFFPEGITTDGTDLYIVDGANHRIKKHQVDGTYLSEFGTNGTGNSNFDYPIGIDWYNNFLYIADKGNHRIKQHQEDGTFVHEFGSYGTGNINFNFPEDVVIFNGGIVVADSGNLKVKLFDSSGTYISQINTTFGYPVGVSNGNNETLIVSDRTGQKVLFFDSAFAFIDEYGSEGSGNDQFYFPQNAFYYSDHLYITDSGNHRIKNTDFIIVVDTPMWADELVKLTKQLYPTGRAFRLNKSNTFWKFHEGLAYSESRAHSANIGLLDSILPDNDNFTTEDATNWESSLGLLNAGSLENRKLAIERKMQHPGNIPARQHYLFLQRELRAAGFDVYVHENRVSTGSGTYEVYNPIGALYGDFLYGNENYGQSGLAFTPIANYILESLDLEYNFGDDVALRNTFFIGGSTWLSSANVDEDRKNEFRDLILKIKPAQTAGFLLITYV